MLESSALPAHAPVQRVVEVNIDDVGRGRRVEDGDPVVDVHQLHGEVFSRADRGEAMAHLAAEADFSAEYDVVDGVRNEAVAGANANQRRCGVGGALLQG